VVVLPAPFGPKKPSTSPLLRENEQSLTAYISPYRFVMLLISISLDIHAPILIFQNEDKEKIEASNVIKIDPL
jgi:hypothetical protein